MYIPSNQAVAKIWLNDPYGDEPLPETSEEDTSEDPFIYTHKTSSKKLSLKDSIVTLQDTAYHYYRIQFVRCLKGQLKEIADKHFNVNPNMEMSERFKRGGRPGVQELFEKLKNKLQPQSLIAKMAYTVADLERPVGSSLTAFVQLFCAQRNHYNQLRRSNLFPAMEWTRFLITFISKYKRNGNDSEYSQLQNKNQETHPDRKLHEMGFKDFKDLIFATKPTYVYTEADLRTFRKRKQLMTKETFHTLTAKYKKEIENLRKQVRELKARKPNRNRSKQVRDKPIPKRERESSGEGSGDDPPSNRKDDRKRNNNNRNNRKNKKNSSKRKKTELVEDKSKADEFTVKGQTFLVKEPAGADWKYLDPWPELKKADGLCAFCKKFPRSDFVGDNKSTKYMKHNALKCWFKPTSPLYNIHLLSKKQSQQAQEHPRETSRSSCGSAEG